MAHDLPPAGGQARTADAAPAPASAPAPARPLVVSIVSHGHGACVQGLLEQIASLSAASVARVVVTLNCPEPPPRAPAQGWPFVLDMVHNAAPLGFGANHNQALRGAAEAFVCVLNPDVALDGADPFGPLVRTAAQDGVGCAYPEQVDASGAPQDFERALPSPSALWARRALGRREAAADWVNAACLVLPRAVWETLGGFDARYFMYCEDVDLSLRLRLAGWRLARAPARMVHAGQRASHRRLRHLWWHVHSLLRLWRSPVYRAAYQKLRLSSRPKVTIGPS